MFISGSYRQIRYKEVKNVLWQGGAKRRKLRLIVIAPRPYHVSKKGKKYYRKPFWMKGMKKIKRGSKDQFLHRESERYRKNVKRKMKAYNVHIQLGLISIGSIWERFIAIINLFPFPQIVQVRTLT